MIRNWLIPALAVFGASMVASVTSFALDAAESDPRTIMTAVYKRPDGDKARARMEMAITTGGFTRKRTLQMRALDFSGGSHRLLLVEAPAEERSTGLLTQDYDDGAKDDDQWLYLPSLHRSTRISGGSRAQAFLGSDFSFADLTRADPEQYDYQLLQGSANVDGEPCWQVQATPRNKKERDRTGYSKSELWVSKSKLLVLQVKAWVSATKALKYIKSTEVREQDGVWTAFAVTARTIKDGKLESETVLRMAQLKYNDSGVSDADFTQGRLARGPE
jgi:hypothetical protein